MVTCALGTIPKGGSAVVAIDVRPVSHGRISNSARVWGAEGDPDPLDDADTEETVVDLPGSAVRFFTVTSTNQANTLEWVFPSPGRVAIRFNEGTGGCAFPAAVGEGTSLPDQMGTAGTKLSFLHDAGVSNDTYYCYTIFNDIGGLGTGPYSAGRSLRARPSADAAVPWAFSTGATSLAPPGIGSGRVHATSNDNAVYAMDKATGTWPTTPAPGWTPVALTGPSQGRPTTIPTTVLGVSQNVIFVTSQAGTVHAINADSGQQQWQRLLDPDPPNAPVLQAAPSGLFRAFGGDYDYILVGTRVSGAVNRFYALAVNDGSEVNDTFWSFDGDDSVLNYGRIGIISNQATVDYPSRRVYFTSYAYGPAPDDKTVWCIDLATDPPTVCWASVQPNVTTSPTVRGGRVYVATYHAPTQTAKVIALEASNGQLAWEIPITNEGPVKAFVMADRAAPATALYFATTSRVWAYDDGGGSASPLPGWPAGGAALPGPSTPILYGGRLYVGAGDGKLHALDPATGADVVAPITLGDGLGTVGSPTIDTKDAYLYVGSEAGVIYKVQRP
jgi:outer membrane protein assembly factor BamB